MFPCPLGHQQPAALLLSDCTLLIGVSCAPFALQAPQQPPRLALPPIIAANCRTPDDVAGEVQQQLKQHPQALVSGVELDMYSALRKMVTDEDIKVQYQARAKMLVVKPQECALPKRQRLPGTVFVVSAGPEDQAAVDQVKVAAEHLGCYVIAKHQLNTQDLPKLMEQATGGYTVPWHMRSACFSALHSSAVDCQLVSIRGGDFADHCM